MVLKKTGVLVTAGCILLAGQIATAEIPADVDYWYRWQGTARGWSMQKDPNGLGPPSWESVPMS